MVLFPREYPQIALRSIFHALLGPKCASASGYNVVVEIQTEISP